jgi:hypothetical protein
MRPALSAGFRKGGHVEDGTGVQVHLSLLLFSLYLSFDAARLFGRPWRELRERNLGVSVHDGSVWLDLWTGDGDWHRNRPWHRNTVCLNVTDWVIGRPRCVMTKGPKCPVLVPMPEGCYEATCTEERWVWTYRFGFKRERVAYWVEIPNGIPFQGKGENSWDCGDDGLFGAGSDGSPEKAVGHVVATVLRSRKRYGNVSRLRGVEPVMAPRG